VNNDLIYRIGQLKLQQDEYLVHAIKLTSAAREYKRAAKKVGDEIRKLSIALQQPPGQAPQDDDLACITDTCKAWSSEAYCNCDLSNEVNFCRYYKAKKTPRID